MDEEQIVLSHMEGHVLTLTMNRPSRLNALNTSLRQQLLEKIAQAATNPEVRVLMITGAGRAFCSGGDVKDMNERKSKGGGGEFSKDLPPVRDQILKLLREMPKPVLAVVNGPAVGAGMGLVMGADLRIAAEDAYFGQVFVKRGLHPDWGGTYFLPKIMGTARAAEMIFSGDMISAKQALDWGLLNKVVPGAELQQAAKDWALQLAKGPPIAIGLAKRGLYRNMESDLFSALEYESYAQTTCWGTEDAAEGLKAFMEKREPDFKGR